MRALLANALSAQSSSTIAANQIGVERLGQRGRGDQ
jgi:hypothetical protein